MGVGAAGEGASFQAGDQVSSGEDGHAGAGSYGGASQVGRDDQIFQGQQRVVGVYGLRLGDVEGGGGDGLGVEGVVEGRRVDDGDRGRRL